MNKKRNGSVYELLNPENIDPVTNDITLHPCYVKITSYSAQAFPAPNVTKKRKPYGFIIPGTVTLYNAQDASFFAKISNLGPKKSAKFKDITIQTSKVNELQTETKDTANRSTFTIYSKPC